MKCRVCHQNKDGVYKSHFRYYKDGAKLQLYICRECNTKKQNKKYQSPIGKKSIIKSIKKYQSKNPIRVKSWIRARELPVRPCEVCAEEVSHKHHPNPEKPLEVIYLCPLHHAQVHNKKLVLQ